MRCVCAVNLFFGYFTGIRVCQLLIRITELFSVRVWKNDKSKHFIAIVIVFREER